MPKPMEFSKWCADNNWVLSEQSRMVAVAAVWDAATAAATAAERERCLDWVRAYSRDCGCAEQIEAAIRSDQEKET